MGSLFLLSVCSESSICIDSEVLWQMTYKIRRAKLAGLVGEAAFEGPHVITA